MIDSRILDVDPTSGITRTMHFDDETECFTIETSQNVESALDISKRSYAGIDERANWKGDWHLVGQIPLNIFYEIRAKYPAREDRDRAIKKWLNDPDNRYWRFRPGWI